MAAQPRMVTTSRRRCREGEETGLSKDARADVDVMANIVCGAAKKVRIAAARAARGGGVRGCAAGRKRRQDDRQPDHELILLNGFPPLLSRFKPGPQPFRKPAVGGTVHHLKSRFVDIPATCLPKSNNAAAARDSTQRSRKCVLTQTAGSRYTRTPAFSASRTERMRDVSSLALLKTRFIGCAGG
jgi:hypothetical protein